jgi:hypothetical protein
MKIAALFMIAAALSAQPISDEAIKKAIAFGQTFKSRSKFLEDGMKASKVQIASSMAKDGISKYVTFFTDFDAVASAAAQANQQMKPFSLNEAKTLPLTGLTYAHIELHARGDLPVRRLNKRFIQNSSHFVLKIGEDVLQPLSKEMSKAQDASWEMPIALFSWWQAGNVSLLTGGTLGMSGGRVEMEYVFRIPDEKAIGPAQAIIIDGDGKRHSEKIDLAKALKR